MGNIFTSKCGGTDLKIETNDSCRSYENVFSKNCAANVVEKFAILWRIGPLYCV